MVVGYGVSVPEGSLAVFSTWTEDAAQKLIVAACPTNVWGEYISPELAREQTIENLITFGDRLEQIYHITHIKEEDERAASTGQR